MKNRILAAIVALAIAVTGFAFGRVTAPAAVDCLAALDAADATITALMTGPDADRFAEIDYPTHRAACEEDAR